MKKSVFRIEFILIQVTWMFFIMHNSASASQKINNKKIVLKNWLHQRSVSVWNYTL